jgi:hypothetical protein
MLDGNSLPSVLIAIVTMSYTCYLVYIQVNKKKRASIITKLPPDSPGYEMHRRIYSFQFLIIAIVTSVALCSGVAMNFFHIAKPTRLYISLICLIFLLIGSAVTLFVWFNLFAGNTREK